MNKPVAIESSPTMIIPSGTEIEVDVHGQLSIRTPGNLVIQNSGNYGTIESVEGSIRIEPNVQVEAVNIQCAESCYVQGSLTAWKVTAKSIQLEDTARAHIILQETQRLEVGKEARLVGNFSSEKELFLLFSRFAKQLRSMPFYFDRRDELDGDAAMKALDSMAGELAGSEGDGDSEPAAGDTAPQAGAKKAARRGAKANDGAKVEAVGERKSSGKSAGKADERETRAKELPESLFFALVLLERESERPGNGPTSQRVLRELVKLLQDRNIEALRHTYQTLFSRVVDPSDDTQRANELLRTYFSTATVDA